MRTERDWRPSREERQPSEQAPRAWKYDNLATQKRMPKVSAKHSPKDTRCLYCGKRCTSKGVYEHERHHCPKNPHRKKRSWGKLKCRVCGQIYHAAGLRTHMATQHPAEFAKDKARKPSSRAAMRRRAARAESEDHRRHKRDTHPGVVEERSPSSNQAARTSSRSEERHHHLKGSSKAMSQMRCEIERAAATN